MKGIIAFALACLACCLPLLIGILGVTTGAAGAAAIWLGRNQALVIAVIGLAYLVFAAANHIRAKSSKTDKVELMQRPG